MSPLVSPISDTTITVAQDRASVRLQKGTDGWQRNGAQWTHPRTNGHATLGVGATNNRAVLHFRKPAGLPDAQPADRQATIAGQDAADMASLCSGDDEAMTRLMRRHAPRLHSVIARMLKDGTEAADVVDEAFIRVYRHRLRFDLQARFTTWLYTIALNLARNRLRHRARQPEIVSLEELSEEELESQQRVPVREPAPDVHLEHDEVMQSLEDSFAALPPQLREPLELFACDELSQIEIASQLRCSAKAIEGRLYHARKRLRADFERFLHPRPAWLFVRPFKPQHEIKIK